MTRAPISSDLLVKLALGAAALGLVYSGYRKITGAAGAVGASISSAVDTAANVVSTSLNPASTENLVYRGINSAGGSLVSDPAGPGKNADGSWSLGRWLYDITHDDPLAASSPPLTPSQGHTAYWKS